MGKRIFCASLSDSASARQCPCVAGRRLQRPGSAYRLRSRRTAPICWTPSSSTDSGWSRARLISLLPWLATPHRARKLQRSRISPRCARWRRWPSLRAVSGRPRYAPDDSGRFYAQWIENAVKGTFDHVCLVFRTDGGLIQGFVSLRRLTEHEARIGLLAGRGMGEKTHAGGAALGGATTGIDAAGRNPDGQHRCA